MCEVWGSNPRMLVCIDDLKPSPLDLSGNHALRSLGTLPCKNVPYIKYYDLSTLSLFLL